MSTVTQTAPSTNPSLVKKLLFGAIAVVAIVLGITKFTQGISKAFGWGSAAFTNLLAESDQAYQEAVEHSEAADSQFKTLLTAVDDLPLASVRSEHKETAAQAAQHFTEAAAQFRAAGSKLDEALVQGAGNDERVKSFLTTRGRACSLLADVCDQNRQIIALVQDDSIATSPDLVAKILESAKSRDAKQAEAEAALLESEALAKQQ